MLAVPGEGCKMVTTARPLSSYCARMGVLQQVSKDGLILMNLPDKWRLDKEIVLAAVSQSGRVLEYVAKELQADRCVVLAAVGHTGWALMYAAPELQADREVVLAAIQQDGSALWFAAEHLKSDREVVMTAVRQKGWALMYAAEELRRDQEIVYAAWCKDRKALMYASESLRSRMPRFNLMSGEQFEIDGCGYKHVVEVKQQIEARLRCRVDFVLDGRIFTELEDRPLAVLGDCDVQIIKLPE